MKRIFKILTLASLVVVMASCNETRREQDQDSNEVAEEANDEKFEDRDVEKDADWVAEVVAANYAEIKLAKLAQTRAIDPQVKSIAKTLEDDHTKTLNELKALAQRKAITIPVEEKEEAKNKYQKLADEENKNFDEKWLDTMEDKHEESIRKFEKRFENSEDAEIKAFANKTLPHLKMHLEKIKSIEEAIDKKDNNL
jgi:putative membrane protein